MDAIYTKDPWRQEFAHLKNSIVPVMVSLQWNSDRVKDGVRALDAMPKTTPTRAFLSASGGHGDPDNTRQDDQNRAFMLRWFDRFLKDIKNQVDAEPRFVTGVVSETAALYQEPEHAAPAPIQFDLGTGGDELAQILPAPTAKALSTQAPTTAESPETIKHVVNSWVGLDPFRRCEAARRAQ